MCSLHVRIHVYLFYSGLKKGDLVPIVAHAYYTKPQFFPIFPYFFSISRHMEMGEHPWVTPIIVSLNTDDYLSSTQGYWQKSAISDPMICT